LRSSRRVIERSPSATRFSSSIAGVVCPVMIASSRSWNATDRCGKDRLLAETHAPERQRDMPIRVLLARARHDGCGGRPGRVELLTGIDGVFSRPARRIVLLVDLCQSGSVHEGVALALAGTRRARWSTQK
jgi:hypothetical protein